jgi:hypothetical protein
MGLSDQHRAVSRNDLFWVLQEFLHVVTRDAERSLPSLLPFFGMFGPDDRHTRLREDCATGARPVAINEQRALRNQT